MKYKKWNYASYIPEFVKYLQVNDLKLNIIGLMCIPPLESNPRYIF